MTDLLPMLLLPEGKEKHEMIDCNPSIMSSKMEGYAPGRPESPLLKSRVGLQWDGMWKACTDRKILYLSLVQFG